MIRPVRFASNAETAASNAFQVVPAGSDEGELQRRALAEFDGLAESLRAAGVRVHVIDDTPEPHTPDSLFPNNWVSFHASGTVVLYPLLTPNRRAEVRLDVLERVEEESGWRWPNRVDLTGLHERGAILEGTGSLVLDRTHRLAYACRSPRTTPAGLEEFAQRMGYEPVVFGALDEGGVEIYHTNVVMGIGSSFAVVCLESIRNATERSMVEGRLRETGHELIAISLEQLGHFAGNCLALESAAGEPLVALSEQALASLDGEQRERLAIHARIVSAPLDTIESVGGGSARCMLAELHEPTGYSSSRA